MTYGKPSFSELTTQLKTAKNEADRWMFEADNLELQLSEANAEIQKLRAEKRVNEILDEEFSIVEGLYYVNRGGDVVGPVEKAGGKFFSWKIGEEMFSFNGHYGYRPGHPKDLVAYADSTKAPSKTEESLAEIIRDQAAKIEALEHERVEILKQLHLGASVDGIKKLYLMLIPSDDLEKPSCIWTTEPAPTSFLSFEVLVENGIPISATPR